MPTATEATTPAAPPAVKTPTAAPPAVETPPAAAQPKTAVPVPAAAGASTRPPAPPSAVAAAPAATVDPAHAKVIADLDQTFAFIAAQANEDAAAPAAASEPAPQEKPASGDGSTAGTALSARQKLWLLAGAALVLLLAMVAAVVWMLKVYDPGLLGGTSLGAADTAWQPIAAQAGPGPSTPLVYPPPGAGLGEAAATAATAAAVGAVAAVGAGAAATAPAAAAPGAADARITPAKPPAPPPAKAAAAPPAKAAERTRAASPRQACGRREGYALLQCMQTQCAKKAWSRHEQCVRLRTERRL
jgi:hypothetical protein